MDRLPVLNSALVNLELPISLMCMSLVRRRKPRAHGIATEPTIFSPQAQRLHTCILIRNAITQSALLPSCSCRESRSLRRASPSTQPDQMSFPPVAPVCVSSPNPCTGHSTSHVCCQVALRFAPDFAALVCGPITRL